jgi:hypothetical protein
LPQYANNGNYYGGTKLNGKFIPRRFTQESAVKKIEVEKPQSCKRCKPFLPAFLAIL